MAETGFAEPGRPCSGVFAAADGSVVTAAQLRTGSGFYPGGLLTRASDGSLYGACATDSSQRGRRVFRHPEQELHARCMRSINTEAVARQGPGRFGGTLGAWPGSQGIGIGGCGHGVPDVSQRLDDAQGGVQRDGPAPVGPSPLRPDGNLYGLTCGSGPAVAGRSFA